MDVDLSTSDVDPAAQALAHRLGGKASQLVRGFGNEEFDFVSDDFIGQTTYDVVDLIDRYAERVGVWYQVVYPPEGDR